ncbi:hypothetical protein GCM10010168_58350 [Actinoplanes ianthinogenes]|uniref:SHOCT domain-containing protein n=1 Tax=Actinoplanes ianthinogenes TaxID=122358 RepID=A0ABM7M277_9ACTN|nr:SHOCT domain-containing protein [Actinoplanes ianthinogenes]BCJ45745.1 hypothetical protein Aiant_64020 [Actinoplanes ianthinogenes]GGR32246.1 hypothetical protein GCM10010168_58350 [Actinoplanes ianthinogenes]
MPGLLRGVARTAVVAGTATAVSNRVSRRQAGRWSRQAQEEEQQYYDQQPEPEPAAPAPDPMSVKLEQLKQLSELKAQGLLTDAEVEVQKSKILNS